MNNVELYESSDGKISIEVRADGDTVWLTLDQMASMFGRDKSTISRHLNKLFLEEELFRDAVVANFATTAPDGKTYNVTHFNLDVIISVGYRVKSVEGVRFRRWATDVLRQYLITGAAINEKRLTELGQVVSILSRSADQLASGIAKVVSTYLPGLVLLRDYDEGAVEITPKAIPSWELTLAEAREIIAAVAAEFPEDTLAGRERGEALEAIVAAVYQGFGGQDVYPTAEEKAAHLLYFMIKDHPLADGNKRSAAALFVSFLARNNLLNDASGSPKLSNNALAAIALLVASSDPKEKELMIALIIRMVESD